MKKIEAGIEAKTKPLRDKLVAEHLASLPEDVQNGFEGWAQHAERETIAVADSTLPRSSQSAWKISDEELFRKFPAITGGNCRTAQEYAES